MTQDLFQLALNITDPWFIFHIQFNVELKQLDVYIDFRFNEKYGCTKHPF